MRIFKHKAFHKWAISEGITNGSLIKAMNEIEQGLFDAKLGDGLYKKRIPRQGSGKSNGYRTLLAFRKFDRAIFIYGFAKNERDNISYREERTYKQLAQYYLEIPETEVITLININELFEVQYEN